MRDEGLDRLMLALVKRESKRVRDATRTRNAAIIAARGAGHSLRAVASAAELSHTAVAKICAAVVGGEQP